MSDLISRGELLKAMDTWDKFGYDEHNRLIKIDRTNEEYVPYVHYEDMVKCVNDMPPAYSVDGIVEELEEMIHPKQLYFCKYARGGCKHLDNNDKDCMECVVENTIEIVKHCGISDDVCEWKDKELYGYYTSCTEFRSRIACKDTYWKYCPYCGKKIKVVE